MLVEGNDSALRHQVCERCGRIYRLGWWIADEHWKMLPNYWQSKKLCIECFLELADSLYKDVVIDGSEEKGFRFHTLIRKLKPEDFQVWVIGDTFRSERFITDMISF